MLFRSVSVSALRFSFRVDSFLEVSRRGLHFFKPQLAHSLLVRTRTLLWNNPRTSYPYTHTRKASSYSRPCERDFRSQQAQPAPQPLARQLPATQRPATQRPATQPLATQPLATQRQRQTGARESAAGVWGTRGRHPSQSEGCREMSVCVSAGWRVSWDVIGRRGRLWLLWQLGTMRGSRCGAD